MNYKLTKNKERWIGAVIWILIVAAYFVVKLKYHELWKDEWQPWLLARDKSYLDMLWFLDLEGHPSLWFTYLKPWALLSNALNLDPDQQVLLFEIAHSQLFLGALIVLIFRFKMPFLLRIATACSFFFFYEYGIVNRGYMLLILLLFILATKWKEENLSGWSIPILLFLICQTEVYGVFAAGALFVALITDYYQKEKQLSFWKAPQLKRITQAMVAGVVCFVITVFPKSGQNVVGLNTDANLIDNIAHSFQGNFSNAFWIGLIPDTNVFGYATFGIVAALVLLALFVWFLYKDKSLLAAFLLYMLAAVVFGTYVYQGGVRHWGVNLIFFIVLLELYFRRNGSFSQWQYGLVISFFLCQFYYNYLAIQKEIRHPFSNAYVTAQFLKDKVPEEVPIVAINKFETAPVVAYSGRDVYALPTGEPFTYYQWLDKVYLPPEAELKVFAQYKNKSGLVLLSPKPLDKGRYPGAELWKAFETYNLKNENYFVYLFAVR